MISNEVILFPSISESTCSPLSLLQVALVFPNNDPVAFMVAFYGCLLAEVVPVPIEVPLSRKVLHEIHPLVPFTSSTRSSGWAAE